ncbi:hypothetical protein ADK70_12315 [Streptomyces rimosus subsp. pseudoverticillatus]|uniref:hypothetical protein n=1 Tax=Streptomyces rimosus TaxID=1927 RepID=UPI0006B29292|nr:hypothetical protein [Streptomyces rimosus]KOT94464.1 hypothetical protein ADK70_12315 [Streptomyces rimosus subsp. pseudoverticillatus]
MSDAAASVTQIHFRTPTGQGVRLCSDERTPLTLLLRQGEESSLHAKLGLMYASRYTLELGVLIDDRTLLSEVEAVTRRVYGLLSDSAAFSVEAEAVLADGSRLRVTFSRLVAQDLALERVELPGGSGVRYLSATVEADAVGNRYTVEKAA